MIEYIWKEANILILNNGMKVGIVGIMGDFYKYIYIFVFGNEKGMYRLLHRCTR